MAVVDVNVVKKDPWFSLVALPFDDVRALSLGESGEEVQAPFGAGHWGGRPGLR